MLVLISQREIWHISIRLNGDRPWIKGAHGIGFVLYLGIVQQSCVGYNTCSMCSCVASFSVWAQRRYNIIVGTSAVLLRLLVSRNSYGSVEKLQASQRYKLLILLYYTLWVFTHKHVVSYNDALYFAEFNLLWRARLLTYLV